MNDDILDERSKQQSPFERRVHQLFFLYALMWLMRIMGSFMSHTMGVTSLVLVGLLVTVWRVLPFFRQAPYPRVQLWSQLLYLGAALWMVGAVAIINNWRTVDTLTFAPRFWLVYGPIALLLVEYYSGFRQKGTHWQVLYALLLWWMGLGFTWLLLDQLTQWLGLLPYGLNSNLWPTSWVATYAWGLCGIWLVGVAVILWKNFPAVPSSDRTLVLGYTFALSCLFMGIEPLSLHTTAREILLMAAALVGVPVLAMAFRPNRNSL